MTNPKELPEFDVKIRMSSYGHVRVRAKNPSEAKNGVEKTNRKNLMKFYKEECRFTKVGEATPVKRTTMVLAKCELDDEINSQTAIFEVEGSYEDEDFHCRIEMNLDPEEVNPDQAECEWLAGSLDSDGLEELISEIIETEEYQAAVDEFQRRGSSGPILE